MRALFLLSLALVCAPQAYAQYPPQLEPSCFLAVPLPVLDAQGTPEMLEEYLAQDTLRLVLMWDGEIERELDVPWAHPNRELVERFAALRWLLVGFYVCVNPLPYNRSLTYWDFWLSFPDAETLDE